jgi:hypothetical protein
MAVPYIPARDADLLSWAQAFGGLIQATPTAYGLITGQATTFNTLVDLYQDALAAATNEATRGRPTVAAKDVAKFNLLANARLLVAIVQAYPPITPSQLSALGLTVRSAGRTPIQAPVTYPLLAIRSIQQLQARLTINDELTPDARRRPANVIGAEVFFQLGGVAPVSEATMTFAGVLSKTPTALMLPSASLGQTVWMRARWITARGLRGPLSPLVSAIGA